jgi:hypothetical protein
VLALDGVRISIGHLIGSGGEISPPGLGLGMGWAPIGRNRRGTLTLSRSRRPVNRARAA